MEVPMDDLDVVLDGMDEGRLLEIQRWWESADVELAADAIQEVAQEVDCSYADAMGALMNAYGERGDEGEIVDILTERDENDDEEEEDEEEEDEDSDNDEESDGDDEDSDEEESEDEDENEEDEDEEAEDEDDE